MSSETVEISMGAKPSVQVDAAEDTVVRNKPPVEVNTDDIKDKAKPGDDIEKVPEDAAQDGDEGADEGGDEGALEDLGEFDPEDAEVLAKFDERYLDADGNMDLEGSLSSEYFANAKAGKEGLNDSTYAYLAAKGITKASVKAIETMAAKSQKADTVDAEKLDGQLFELAGGPDALKAALDWGKKGGYTDAQQKRFNDINSGSDFEARQEAVEALMARYAKANPKGKPQLPARDATKGQGKPAPGVQGFKDRAEMRKVRDALKDNDKAGWAAFNARRKLSKFD